ncbi:MAG: hypothetical protein C5B48_09960 [Candidatus Rokuibacteriota bacterium]|nr:MAG: hypothetical protein C5B48_09960 [Candidatus Rokubacteria bacterium]
MKLCMFHPLDHPLERGWVGRVENDHVVQLAAQTLQSFFTGGGSAREHAVYPLAAVRFLPPVLHPPAVRIFEDQNSFEFGNPAAIVGPDAEIVSRPSLRLCPRLGAVLGADGEIGGYTLCADWCDPGLEPPKDHDFALGLGPVVATADELDAEAELVVRVDGDERLRSRPQPFDWSAARELALAGTTLYPGDLLVGPAAGATDRLRAPSAVGLEVAGVGELRQTVVIA